MKIVKNLIISGLLVSSIFVQAEESLLNEPAPLSLSSQDGNGVDSPGLSGVSTLVEIENNQGEKDQNLKITESSKTSKQLQQDKNNLESIINLLARCDEFPGADVTLCKELSENFKTVKLDLAKQIQEKVIEEENQKKEDLWKLYNNAIDFIEGLPTAILNLPVYNNTDESL